MKLKASVVLLSVCGLTAMMPVQAHEFDGVLFAARDSYQQDRRDERQARKAKRAEQQERQAEQAKAEPEPERGYGYGYERRHSDKNDGRSRR
jgi:hypothetical protein